MTTTAKEPEENSPMASSSTPLHIIDDVEDEEFDWEAAVREIDVACAKTSATTNFDSNPSLKVEEIHKRDVFSKRAAGFSSSSCSRQSTLDRFIGIASNSNATKSEGEKRKSNFYSNGLCKDGGDLAQKSSKSEEEEGDDTEGNISFVKIDPDAAKTWIYPVKMDHPLRDYQFNISRTALFSNTLVALPTGLGKTFIAAVVMYNYFRWFPEGKIVFAAPSRPLVLQQIEACHNIGGIPQEWAIDLTGQTSPTRRAHHWKSKRVFFVTPQVLEKDIYSGSCLVKHLVCLVIDEAHRATGNYSYCVAVRELMAAPVPLRILALTATPGSKQDTVQHIFDNLQVSTLEYRDETDPDVKPYVQDRKIELIEVPMGKDATETNNLILEVIRPYAARLSALGVLPNRDFQTLSPCDLLNSRDQFRQKPPEGLPQMKYGEIEGFFGALVTLYHIRKLLSSHGIKPAFEMLEEKLKQGSFARLMCRNEGLLKAKLLMQQHIFHGAPSPKLSKLMDVLITHFKRKDPQNSRVIIFSNFRGSVRDIINALKNIGEFVKATEFIGQSSGKSLKGQSQKVQQAVLQKFRAGQYNVIVATSIGEEGLDIMEVDLVICFDANISSLRMIQRMGRTGRKHQACEGSELKGYKRKQANGKTIKKYMRNGTANFRFHSSPRMIPHCFKPEVQFLQLSVEQFVPRVKKVHDDADVETSAIRIKLTDAEKNLIAKYFNSTRENIWKPSLIAFPHFQTFPSRVHKVPHSVRTGMLIDAMQLLQGISSPEDDTPFIIEAEVSPRPHSKTEALKQCIEHKKGELLSDASVSELKVLENLTKDDYRQKVLQTDEKCAEGAFAKKENLAHSFLFVSQLVFVDDLGRVQISSPPHFPSKLVSYSNSAVPNRSELQYPQKEDSVHFEASIKGNGEMILQAKDNFAVQMRSKTDEEVVESKLSDSVARQGELLVADEGILQPPVPVLKSNEEEGICDSPRVVEYRTSTFLPDESMDDPGDAEFSPRLTNFVESGFVPESPINDAGIPEVTGDASLVPHGLYSELAVKYSQQNNCVCETDVPSFPIKEIQSPGPNANNVSPACKSNFRTVEMQTPLKLQDSNFSEYHLLNSQGKSQSVEQKCKLKRLRKLGDLQRKRPPDCKKKKNGQTSNFASASHFGIQHGRGQKQHINNAKVFIEEEAEVSSDDMVTDDEEQEPERNSFDDSFIDDRTNPTAESTQAEIDGIDMMAVYRRSLLSQSPIQRMPNISSDFTPNSEVSKSGSISTSIKTNQSQTPQNGSESTARKVAASHLDHVRFCSNAMPFGSNDYLEEHEGKMESRKRKLSLCQARYLPVQNLENKFLHHSEARTNGSIFEVEAGRENRKTCNENRILENRDAFEDDQFYDDLDLDAVEEQAVKLLRQRSESSDCSLQKHVTNPEPMPPNLAVIGSPSFDLGI